PPNPRPKNSSRTVALRWASSVGRATIGRYQSAAKGGEHDHVVGVVVGGPVEGATTGDQAQHRLQGRVVDLGGREAPLRIPLDPLDGEGGPRGPGPEDRGRGRAAR